MKEENNTQNKPQQNNIIIEIPQSFLALYPYAKEAILFFETQEGKMSVASITDLRDCFDHLMMAFQNTDNQERQQSEITSSLEHLRRASIEPLELAIENRLYNIEGRYKRLNFYKAFLIPTPSRSTVSELITSIQKRLNSARHCKNIEHWEEGIRHLREAHTLSIDLDKLVPEKHIFWGRIFALAIAIIPATISFLITYFLMKK